MPEVPILLCGWHVKTAWAKQLLQKIADVKTRESLGAALDKLMRLNVAAPDSFTDEQLQHMIRAALDKFYKDFVGEAAFIKYFKAHWDPKASKCMCGLGNVKFTVALLVNLIRECVLGPGMWCQLFRNMFHCNQETTGAIEAYHRVLKVNCHTCKYRAVVQNSQ